MLSLMSTLDKRVVLRGVCRASKTPCRLQPSTLFLPVVQPHNRKLNDPGGCLNLLTEGKRMATGTRTPTLKLVWEPDGLAIDLLPLQGLWTEEQYLRLTDQTNCFIEFTEGSVEVLPMPTRKHRAISRFLFLALFVHVQRLGGTVFYAPLRVRVAPGRFREPDLVLLLDVNDPRNQNAFWLGADLVVEIVSPDDVERDTVIKRADYAAAGIPEYWIINPSEDMITVLKLEADAYSTHGVFRRGETATSALLVGFTTSVDAVCDAE
jgi:Uma2 family endonuclease